MKTVTSGRWRKRAAWTCAAWLLALGAPGGASGQVEGPPPVPGFTPCESMRGSAWCGTVTVPEDHANPSSRRIDLRVKVLSATEPSAADPVFFLAGGPGQAVADLEPAIIGRFATRLPDRDFVLVDQRGTGGSNPLSCPTDAPRDPSRFFGPHYTEAELKACLSELAPRADVRLYTTTDFARDLEAVRVAMGYGPINVVGGSYGTKAAQVFMRAFPASVRAAVLEGVASTSFLNPLPAARGSQDALDALFADCAADEKCNRIFPDLKARFQRLMERLEADPPPVTVPGSDVTVPLERDAMAYIVHLLLFSTNSATLVPSLIGQVEGGHHQILTAVYKQSVDSLVEGIYFGLQLTVTCTENVPWFAQRDLDAETRGTYIGRMMVDGMAEECTRWPRGAVPAGFHDPVTVDVPTLLVSGGLDPATPRRFADEVAESLPRATHVTVAQGAHITPHPCVDQIVADFIIQGGPETLSTGCVDRIRRPPFQLPQVDVPRGG